MTTQYGEDGLPYGIGNLSIGELSTYLKKLPATTSVTLDINVAFEAKHPIVLLRNRHYILFLPHSTGLIVFDSYGAHHASSILGVDVTAMSSYMQYQEIGSDTCGLFVCLAATVYSKLSEINPVVIKRQFWDELNNYLSSSVVINEFNMKTFGILMRIGEEFSDRRYRYTQSIVDLCEFMRGP
jgi:hypothetical protein